MRVGWITDTVEVPGGAELSLQALKDSCPGEIANHYDESIGCVGGG